MITKPIRFIQIAVNSDHIYGLTPEGEVYYRDKISFSYTSFNHRNNCGNTTTKKDDEEKKVWKKLLMEYRLDVPRGGPERDAQPSNEPEQPAVDIVVAAAAGEIYKDVDTVKSVQTALRAKGFYREAWKIDGDLGKLTRDAIKEFQKSVRLKETGEIDLTLWNALGLNQNRVENENTVETIELNDEGVEDYNEVFIGA